MTEVGTIGIHHQAGQVLLKAGLIKRQIRKSARRSHHASSLRLHIPPELVHALNRSLHACHLLAARYFVAFSERCLVSYLKRNTGAIDIVKQL